MPDASKLIRAISEMARVVGSPSYQLVDTLLQRYFGGGLFGESMRHHFEQVRADLAGPSPTAMEAILADQAAVCWLARNCYERAAELATDPRPADTIQRQRKVDGAHRRFLASLKTLATVRKLALPDLKLTIDRRSVRVGLPTSDARAHAIEVEGRPA